MGGHLNGVVHENKNVDVMGVHVIDNDDLCFNKIADSRIKRWCTKKHSRATQVPPRVSVWGERLVGRLPGGSHGAIKGFLDKRFHLIRAVRLHKRFDIGALRIVVA